MNRGVILSLVAAVAFPAAAAQDRAPELSRKGRTVVMYKDPNVAAVLGYRWMNAHADATWVPLQFAIAGNGDKPIDLAREDIALIEPGGERIPLPSQEAFQKGVRQPEAILKAVSINRDPIAGYFPWVQRNEPLALFTVNDAAQRSLHLAYDRVSVDRATLAIGMLWFPLPAGVRPGRYTLRIESKWAHVDIPFDVPAPPLGKGTDEGVNW